MRWQPKLTKVIAMGGARLICNAGKKFQTPVFVAIRIDFTVAGMI